MFTTQTEPSAWGIGCHGVTWRFWALAAHLNSCLCARGADQCWTGVYKASQASPVHAKASSLLCTPSWPRLEEGCVTHSSTEEQRVSVWLWVLSQLLTAKQCDTGYSVLRALGQKTLLHFYLYYQARELWGKGNSSPASQFLSLIHLFIYCNFCSISYSYPCSWTKELFGEERVKQEEWSSTAGFIRHVSRCLSAYLFVVLFL